jgi:Holliday junction resolvase-like predicted endonuclease
VIDRNVRVGRGELDLIVSDGAQRVAVEVKTRRGEPLDSFTPAKARQVRSLAARLGIGRVDLVAVSIDSEGVHIRWVPAVG